VKGGALVAALAVAFTVSAAPRALAQAETIRILDATYGDATTRRLCDATSVVAALCDEKNACDIPIGNALCGDPAFGTPKQLHLAFKCGGSVPQLLIAAEPGRVHLVCANTATGPRT
jgi:hypothetical protein